MRVLFDHGTPDAIARSLTNHTVTTARSRGWATLSNGALLRQAEGAGFEVLLTTDNSIGYQQNLKNRKIAIVVLNRNRLLMILRVIQEVVTAVDEAKPGDYIRIAVPIR